MSDPRTGMPPLSLDVLSTLGSMELSLGGHTALSPSNAYDYLRTYTVEMFKVLYAFYSRFPRYKEQWIPASAVGSIERAMNVYREGSDFHYRTYGDAIRQDLIDTLNQHLADIANTESSPKTSAPTANNSVATQLKALKDESRMTFQHLAELVGADITTIQRHIGGKLNPRADKIEAYEEAFGKKLGRSIKIKTP